jgi:predicted lipoprotein with Yx(FWY)xxD motif
MRGALATVAALGASLVFAAPGCGDDDPERTAETPAPAPAAPAAQEVRPAAAAPGTKLRLIDSRWGKILAGPKSRAIYLFTREKGTKSKCYGQCAVEWPPVLTKGKPRAAAGLDAALGTTKRRDGKSQVTYNGHPLYYWYKDPPGQVFCQAVDEFGGFWYIVDPDGKAITEP